MLKSHEIDGIPSKGKPALEKQQIVFSDSIKPKLRGLHGGVIDSILLDTPKREYQVDNVSNTHVLTVQDNSE